MSRMEDQLKEETLIAKEQDQSGTALSSDTFITPIEDIVTPKVIALEESTSLSKVVEIMQTKNIGSVVLTRDGELTGILTERDLLMKVMGIHDDWKDSPASKFMTEDPQSLRGGDEIAYVLNNMKMGGYRHIPIVDEENRPVSMLSIKDVVSWILGFFPEEIMNMTGEPFRGKSKREGA